MGPDGEGAVNDLEERLGGDEAPRAPPRDQRPATDPPGRNASRDADHVSSRRPTPSFAPTRPRAYASSGELSIKQGNIVRRGRRALHDASAHTTSIRNITRRAHPLQPVPSSLVSNG